MTRNNASSNIISSTTGAAVTPPPQAMTFQNSGDVSALSQQLNHVPLDNTSSSGNNNYNKAIQHPSPKKASEKRKSKSDYSGIGSGHYDLSQTQTKPRRSPKTKVNGTKHLSTPSKPASMANTPVSNTMAQPHGTTANELAEHYAGPTFHSSPAPSSLPMPSFFASKSSSPKPVVSNGYEFDSPPKGQSTPSRQIQPLNGNTFQDQDDSPLAFFFRADREEKNKLRNKYSSENGVFGSPSLRPTSASGVPDHLNIGSRSPLLWHDSPQKANGRLDLKNHSTSELPFQVNESVIPSGNNLVQRYRVSTEPFKEHNTNHHGNDAFNDVSQRSQQGSYVPLPPQRQSLYETDLETSTQTLKSLLSIKSAPDHPKATPPFAPGDVPLSPSPIQHNRTRSGAPPIVRRTLPTSPTTSPSRRVVSTSGVTPITFNHTSHHRSTSPNESPEQHDPSDDPETIKMEKRLRKVLNLS